MSYELRINWDDVVVESDTTTRLLSEYARVYGLADALDLLRESLSAKMREETRHARVQERRASMRLVDTSKACARTIQMEAIDDLL